jgi:hypothetical protein
MTFGTLLVRHLRTLLPVLLGKAHGRALCAGESVREPHPTERQYSQAWLPHPSRALPSSSSRVRLPHRSPTAAHSTPICRVRLPHHLTSTTLRGGRFPHEPQCTFVKVTVGYGAHPRWASPPLRPSLAPQKTPPHAARPAERGISSGSSSPGGIDL